MHTRHVQMHSVGSSNRHSHDWRFYEITKSEVKQVEAELNMDRIWSASLRNLRSELGKCLDLHCSSVDVT